MRGLAAGGGVEVFGVWEKFCKAGVVAPAVITKNRVRSDLLVGW